GTQPSLDQSHRRLDQRLERLRVDLVALAPVDGAAGVAAEARVEEVGGVVEGGSAVEGGLHRRLVGLAGADDLAGVVPDGDASPLPLFDNVRVGFVDERPDAGEGLATPVVEVGDALVDEV